MKKVHGNITSLFMAEAKFAGDHVVDFVVSIHREVADKDSFVQFASGKKMKVNIPLECLRDLAKAIAMHKVHVEHEIHNHHYLSGKKIEDSISFANHIYVLHGDDANAINAAWKEQEGVFNILESAPDPY